MSKDVSIIIERGTEQIGGCCTLIKYGHTCIAIDIGSELPGKNGIDLYVPELMEGSDCECKGLFLTHYHGDHIGEICKLADGIDIYSSKTTKQVMEAYQMHMGEHCPFCVDMDRIIEMQYGSSIVVGEFTVTPIASDHSAIGSVMYLIEVGGKRILHTGDFRLHGKRKYKLLEAVNHLGNIDLLITEGTTLTRQTDEDPWDEGRVKWELKRLYSKYKYVFVLVSSTNLDRLQMVSEQVERGRYFIVSRFQKQLMELAEELDECVFQKPLYYSEFLNEKMRKHGFVMVINSSDSCIRLMEEYFRYYEQESCLIYSMWSGYLEYENIKRVSDIAGYRMFHVHSSGHVTVDDLNGFIDAINPEKILVIHTESNSKENIKLVDRIISVKDGEPIIIS